MKLSEVTEKLSKKHGGKISHKKEGVWKVDFIFFDHALNSVHDKTEVTFQRELGDEERVTFTDISIVHLSSRLPLEGWEIIS